MNRRQFTQRLAALATAPVLPTGMMGQAMAATATRPLHQFQHPYTWAAFISRIHDKASPQMFQRHLSLDDATAKQVFDTLVRENVISAPNAVGLSHAMNPFKRSFGASIGASPQSAFKPKVEIESKLDKAKEAYQDLIEENPEPVDDSEAVNLEPAKCADDPDTCENPEHGSANIDS